MNGSLTCRIIAFKSGMYYPCHRFNYFLELFELIYNFFLAKVCASVLVSALKYEPIHIPIETCEEKIFLFGFAL